MCNGKYQMFSVTNTYDKKTKKSKKKMTYIGTINEHYGLLEPKLKAAGLQNEVIEKEYGQLLLVKHFTKDILDDLKEFFPDCYQTIFTISFLRLIDQTSLNEIKSEYDNNAISNTFPRLPLSASSLTKFLNELGLNRNAMVKYMSKNILNSETILFDGTSIFSKSENLTSVGIGHNHHGIFEEQYGIMFGYSLVKKEMVYYRIFDGSMRDHSVIKDVEKEIPLDNLCFIADKGFSSKQLFEDLVNRNAKYIVPLRRNTVEVPDWVINDLNGKQATELFNHEDRPVYAYKITNENNTFTHVFIDYSMRAVEKKDNIDKMQNNEKYTLEKFRKESERFGFFIIKTNLAETSKNIYTMYKLRNTIEVMIDVYKNTFEFDKSYMQDDDSLNGLLFLNHISLVIASRIYEAMRTKNLLGKMSIGMVFKILRKVRVIRHVHSEIEA
jgi:transposase